MLLHRRLRDLETKGILEEQKGKRAHHAGKFLFKTFSTYLFILTLRPSHRKSSNDINSVNIINGINGINGIMIKKPMLAALAVLFFCLTAHEGAEDNDDHTATTLIPTTPSDDGEYYPWSPPTGGCDVDTPDWTVSPDYGGTFHLYQSGNRKYTVY